MKIKRTLLCLFMVILIIFSLQTTSKAASFSVKAANSTVDIGKTTSLTINASGYLGKFQISSSDSNIVSISESTKWIEDTSVSITLTAKKAGKATITVTALNVSDTSGNVDISGNKQSVTITVTDPTPTNQPQPSTNGGSSNNNAESNTPSKSSDNSLTSLTVGSKNYSKPKKDITVPSVSSGTTSIELKAEANDSKASVSGTGTKELTTGTNKFTITVTAENGSKANYIVRITRLAEENNEPNIEDNTPTPVTFADGDGETNEEPEQELRLSSLVIEGVELTPLFNSEVFEYTIYLVDEEELNVTAVPNIEGATVEVVGNTGLAEGENTIIVKLTKDEKIVEYKIIANKSSETVIEEVKQDDDNNKKSFIGVITNWWNKSGPMSIIFTIILALLGASIIFAVVSYKYSNNVKTVSKHSKENFATNKDFFDNGNSFKD